MNDTMKEAAGPKRPMNIKEDMSLYSKESIDNYNFFLKLFSLFTREKKVMVNDSLTLYDYYCE